MKGLHLIFIAIILFFTFSCSKELSIDYFGIKSDTLTMYSTEQQQIMASVSFTGTDSIEMTWSSSNEAIAKVNKNGLVTALRPGEAIITVKCLDLERKCKITVEHQTYFVASANNTTYTSIILWANGKFSSITSSQFDASPTDIDVEKTNIYISGMAQSLAGENQPIHAAYWKNGAIVELDGTEIESAAYGIAVEKDTVYTVGEVGKSAILWKNSRSTIISQSGTASDIKVHKGKTYVSGIEMNGNISNAVIWVNGEKQILPGNNAEAKSIAIDTLSNAIYVAGITEFNGHNVATIWQNGNPTRLLDTESSAQSIHFYDGKIYVCGNEKTAPYSRPFIWSNSTINYLGAAINNYSAASVSATTMGVFTVGEQKVFDEILGKFTTLPIMWTNQQINLFDPIYINISPTAIFTR